MKRFEGKNYGYYVIIPNMIGEDKKKDAKRTFYLRIFSSDPVNKIKKKNRLFKSKNTFFCLRLKSQKCLKQ